MRTLGLNLFDDSLCETPKRTAKMFVNEIFSGLNPNNKPEISLFENTCGYKKMLIKKDITLYSTYALLEADHLCVAARGVNDTNSKTFTATYSGQFGNDTIRKKFLSHIQNRS